MPGTDLALPAGEGPRAEFVDDSPSARAEARFRKLVDCLSRPRSPIAEDMLRRYCIAAAEADDAQEAIDRTGTVLVTKDGVRINPYVTVRDAALATMAKLAERLDLDLSRIGAVETTLPAVRAGKGAAIGRPPKFKVKTVRKALERAGGSMTGAGEILGCSRRTVADYINRHPTLAAALEEINEIDVDEAETNLKRGVRRGDGWAVCFTLKTKGKDRGYVERTEFTGKNGGAIQSEVTVIELPDNGRGDRAATG